MQLPRWVKVLTAVTSAIPIALLVIEARAFGVGALIFAVVVGAPIFALGRRRGRRLVERDERRWAESEARYRRS